MNLADVARHKHLPYLCATQAIEMTKWLLNPFWKKLWHRVPSIQPLIVTKTTLHHPWWRWDAYCVQMTMSSVFRNSELKCFYSCLLCSTHFKSTLTLLWLPIWTSESKNLKFSWDILKLHEDSNTGSDWITQSVGFSIEDLLASSEHLVISLKIVVVWLPK